jgi:hypothetical protein
MIKLSKELYERVLFAAEEAKELELNDLAEGVVSALGPTYRDQDDLASVSQAELKKEIYKTLWKLAFDVAAYHDVKKMNIQNVGSELEILSDYILNDLEMVFGKIGCVGVLEPKVPGEK